MAEKLNRDVIARAGLRLLDATGIEGITMRALAAELGVQAPTLYWHVKSKQDIFRAMAVAMSRDASALVTAADSGAPWQERLISWAHALRRSMLLPDSPPILPYTYGESESLRIPPNP